MKPIERRRREKEGKKQSIAKQRRWEFNNACIFKIPKLGKKFQPVLELSISYLSQLFMRKLSHEKTKIPEPKRSGKKLLTIQKEDKFLQIKTPTVPISIQKAKSKLPIF